MVWLVYSVILYLLFGVVEIGKGMFLSMVLVMIVVLYVFIGFELIVNVVEEMDVLDWNLLRVILIVIFLVGVIYLFILMVVMLFGLNKIVVLGDIVKLVVVIGNVIF